ncbi:MAG: pyruvate kinase alpha/beta domain-containing protein [Candidatus Bathyarchaeia archaeon]
MGLEKKIIYYDKLGEENTLPTFEAAKRRADELGIKDILVASTRGNVGLLAADFFKGYKLVVVAHSQGFKEPGRNEMPEEVQAKIRALGGKILVTGHAFAGVSRAINRKFSTLGPAELIASVLRLFGQGMKVCVEITFMAADSGMIPMTGDVVAIAGSGRGADTSVVIKPAHLNDMFDLYVKEIITKPNTC